MKCQIVEGLILKVVVEKIAIEMFHKQWSINFDNNSLNLFTILNCNIILK